MSDTTEINKEAKIIIASERMCLKEKKESVCERERERERESVCVCVNLDVCVCASLKCEEFDTLSFSS